MTTEKTQFSCDLQIEDSAYQRLMCAQCRNHGKNHVADSKPSPSVITETPSAEDLVQHSKDIRKAHEKMFPRPQPPPPIGGELYAFRGVQTHEQIAAREVQKEKEMDASYRLEHGLTDVQIKNEPDSKLDLYTFPRRTPKKAERVKTVKEVVEKSRGIQAVATQLQAERGIFKDPELQKIHDKCVELQEQKNQYEFNKQWWAKLSKAQLQEWGGYKAEEECKAAYTRYKEEKESQDQ